MKTVFSVLVFVMIPVMVQAQGIFNSPEPAQTTYGTLRAPIFVYSAAATADWGTTHRSLSHGFREMNPLIGDVCSDKPNCTVIAGALMDVGIVVGVKHLFRDHPKVAKAVLYGVAALKVNAAWQNHKRYKAYRALHDRP